MASFLSINTSSFASSTSTLSRHLTASKMSSRPTLTVMTSVRPSLSLNTTAAAHQQTLSALHTSSPAGLSTSPTTRNTTFNALHLSSGPLAPQVHHMASLDSSVDMSMRTASTPTVTMARQMSSSPPPQPAIKGILKSSRRSASGSRSNSGSSAAISIKEKNVCWHPSPVVYCLSPRDEDMDFEYEVEAPVRRSAKESAWEQALLELRAQRERDGW